MDNLLEVLVAFVLILSLFLLVFSFITYRQTGSRKMLFIMGVFVLFTLKGVLMSLALFSDIVDLELDPALVLIDLFILITLYLTIIVK